MISVQPILSIKYFQLRANKLPKGIKRMFYLSWEDALWDILLKKNIAKGSYVLVPNFYCLDVVENIKNHGYKPVCYQIRKNLTASKKDFTNKITKYKPKAVIVFNPVGITSNLFDDTRWLKNALKQSILIEDSVHNIINPSKVKIIKKNHFVIDSLRKVVPLQGSNLYGRRQDLNFLPPGTFQSFFYKIKVCIYWFLMVIAWSFKKFSIAEKLMLKGYKIIGDSMLPASGPFISSFLSMRINIKEIEAIKKRQVELYEFALKNKLPVRALMSEADKGKLRGYPLILPNYKASKIIEAFRKKKVFVRFELDEFGWSQKYKIIYLPLGIQMNRAAQDHICELSYNTLNAKD